MTERAAGVSSRKTVANATRPSGGAPASSRNQSGGASERQAQGDDRKRDCNVEEAVQTNRHDFISFLMEALGKPRTPSDLDNV